VAAADESNFMGVAIMGGLPSNVNAAIRELRNYINGMQFPNAASYTHDKLDEIVERLLDQPRK